MNFAEDHRRAEILAVEAGAAKAEGDFQHALNLYEQAAYLELDALNKIPQEKVRTRSILSVSAASLLYKAQMLEDAELKIFGFLSSKDLEPWAEQQLRELLPVVSDEKMLATSFKQRYSGESIIVALRGGEIGSGTGPLDLIIEKASGFRSLLYRFAEWIGKHPLRRQGNPPKEVTDLIQARATEPSPGSYRLEIRLTEPLQLALFEANPINPQKVSETMFKFLSQLTIGDSSKLDEIIPQEDYRKALLQLTKNVTPAGKRIKEIGIYRKREQEIESIYLTDTLPSRIREVLPKQPKNLEEKQAEIRGILRALHLDKNWLELTLPDKKHIKCNTMPDMLDDVVGPMVNREVIVRGPMQIRRGISRILVVEIELSDQSE